MNFDELIRAVADGDATRAQALTESALGSGANPDEILSDALMRAMETVGHQFSAGEIYVPEMLVAARAMKVCIGVLQPLMTTGPHKARGTVVIGTVQGDIHDVGKNIVTIMLQAAGFDVHDLGVDVASEAFVAAVSECRPDIVGLSALLTTTMWVMKDVIHALEASGVRDTVRVLVGGAPVTEAFAHEIGADAYAPDAGAAAEVARQLVEVGAQAERG